MQLSRHRILVETTNDLSTLNRNRIQNALTYSTTTRQMKMAVTAGTRQQKVINKNYPI